MNLSVWATVGSLQRKAFLESQARTLEEPHIWLGGGLLAAFEFLLAHGKTDSAIKHARWRKNMDQRNLTFFDQLHLAIKA